MLNKNADNKKYTSPFPKMEEDVLDFWDKAKIFEKSLLRPGSGGQAVEKPAHNTPPTPSQEGTSKEGNIKDYVFYDGPPFATGAPHYGHIVASVMKDVVPRYWTMRGYRVERRWGWDCHGLPIENIVEKEIGSKSKKDIEKLGVEKFNELCRSKVLGYVDEWKKVIKRLGRWADMENCYKTMDLKFMESVWWVFKELWDKGLIYEGYRSMHICPRCETTLSQSEVAEGYKDIKDLSAVAKFRITSPLTPLLIRRGEEAELRGEVYILAWTTTPWTLIGNVALAVGEDIEYILVKSPCKERGRRQSKVKSQDNEKKYYILAKDRIDDVFKDKEYEIVKKFKGKDLIGLKYEPLFDYYAKDKKLENHKNGWKIYGADFVATDEGTGVVHIAPAFGEDDMSLGKEHNLPFIQHLGMDGVIKKEAKDFAGMNVKPIGDHQKTDIEIIKYLAHNDLLFAKEKYEHSYPHCWRCDTPLINYATSSWFVNIEKIKNQMLETAKDINWSPKHIKKGRWGNWLEGARDWSISRQRFWASVMPIWRCEECERIEVFGSVKELENVRRDRPLACPNNEKINDLHKHVVDKITFKCEKCGGEMRRVPDVLDTWFDSGSMPYAQAHYPFENKEKFEKNFPAEFIAEGVDQTRCWFYYLHAIANGIMKKPAYKNVIVNGIVLAKDGKKMSKKLQNYPDPSCLFEKYSADALRYCLLSSPVMMAENLNFSEDGVKEALRKNIMLLWNVYKFYEMYADRISDIKYRISDNILDKWIIARLNRLIAEVTENMDNYNLPKAARPIEEFISDLSTWYLRRSRDRFKSDDQKDKEAALQTTAYVLIELSKVMAPFMPFIAEQIWQRVSGNHFKDEDRSVHLERWPLADSRQQTADSRILEEMEQIRKIVELGLAARDEHGVKVRQPLRKLEIRNLKFEIKEEYIDLIKDELNVKSVETHCDASHDASKEGELKVELDTKITAGLKQEGIKRELVRFINNLRKNAGMTIQDRVVVYWECANKEIKQAIEKYKEDILKDVLANEIIEKLTDDFDIKKEVEINGEQIILGIKKM